MDRDRAACGEAKLDHEGDGQVDGFGLGPFGIVDYDGPETIRMRKYATGTHLLLEEIGVETGATPREVVWTKNTRPVSTATGAQKAEAARDERSRYS